MPPKPSRFVEETRERESWLAPFAERTGEGPEEARRLLATAALIRGTVEAIAVPEDGEERSRAVAVAAMQELHLERRRSTEAVAPWYLRLGSFMRYVFTLGRRR